MMIKSIQSQIKKNKLLIAVVQAQDCDIAMEVLEKASFSVTRLHGTA